MAERDVAVVVVVLLPLFACASGVDTQAVRSESDPAPISPAVPPSRPSTDQRDPAPLTPEQEDARRRREEWRAQQELARRQEIERLRAQAASEAGHQAPNPEDQEQYEGPSETRQRRREYVESHPGRRAEIRAALRSGSLEIGMTGEEVRLILPREVRVENNVTHSAYGTHEQWCVYRWGDLWMFLYFDDGFLSTVQYSR